MKESKLDDSYLKASLYLGIFLVVLLLTLSDLAHFNPTNFLVTPSNPKDLPLGFTLITLGVWLLHSHLWKHCNPIARKKYSSLLGYSMLNLFAFIILTLAYTVLVQASFLEGTSLLWHVFFISLGAATGFSSSVLAEAALLIRTKDEAESLGLPITPTIVKAQFKVWLPVVFVLFTIYYLVQKYLIINLNWLEATLFSLGFLNEVLRALLPYYFSQDKMGKRVSFQERAKVLREILDKYDYMSMLTDIRKELQVEKHKTPEELQIFAREKINEGLALKRDLRFQGKYLGMTEDGIMQMEIIYSDEKIPSEIVALPQAYFTELLDSYILKNTPKNQGDMNKAISYAFNEGVIRVWKEKKIPRLDDLVSSRQYDVLKDFVSKHEVDLNERGNGGWTPLLHASANGYLEIMELLLVHGANPDCKNLLDRTPLHFGAVYNNNEVCELLIEYGANLNLQDEMGNTPLMTASTQGNLKLVQILINAGADKSLKNKAGLTALDLAQQEKHGEIAKRLRKK